MSTRQEWITAHRQNQKGFRPQIDSFGLVARPRAVTIEHMKFMTLEYAYALADCRSCLASLADQSPFELSVFYERLLLLLDALHGDCVPALYTITGMPDELYARLMVGLDRLIQLRRSCD